MTHWAPRDPLGGAYLWVVPRITHWAPRGPWGGGICLCLGALGTPWMLGELCHFCHHPVFLLWGPRMGQVCVGGHCPSPFPPLPFHLSAGQPKARPALGEKGEGGRGRGKDAHVAQNAVQPPPPSMGVPSHAHVALNAVQPSPLPGGSPPMPGCAGAGGRFSSLLYEAKTWDFWALWWNTGD